MRLAPLQSRRRAEVQMAPLIDCIFLLLIFYAVTTQFVTDERLKLKLPEAKTAEDAGTGAADKPPVVVVAADGTVWVDDQLVPEDQLEAKIRQMVGEAPEQSIILKGDRDADYGVVVHVLDIEPHMGGIRCAAFGQVTDPAQLNVSVKAIQMSHAYSHHSSPPAVITHSTAAIKGPPSARASRCSWDRLASTATGSPGWSARASADGFSAHSAAAIQ